MLTLPPTALAIAGFLLPAAVALASTWAAIHLLFWLLPSSSPVAARRRGTSSLPLPQVVRRAPRDIVAVGWFTLRITTTRLRALLVIPPVLRAPSRVLYAIGACASLVFILYAFGAVLAALVERFANIDCFAWSSHGATDILDPMHPVPPEEDDYLADPLDGLPFVAVYYIKRMGLLHGTHPYSTLDPRFELASLAAPAVLGVDRIVSWISRARACSGSRCMGPTDPQRVPFAISALPRSLRQYPPLGLDCHHAARSPRHWHRRDLAQLAARVRVHHAGNSARILALSSRFPRPRVV
ncbi:hypothetical protein BC828DRAFT_391740 [Blastocladiella britannica]|nr:hypothetical protein BC828DRAFT_391740 [Blastocladiella britannica]